MMAWLSWVPEETRGLNHCLVLSVSFPDPCTYLQSPATLSIPACPAPALSAPLEASFCPSTPNTNHALISIFSAVKLKQSTPGVGIGNNLSSPFCRRTLVKSTRLVNGRVNVRQACLQMLSLLAWLRPPTSQILRQSCESHSPANQAEEDSPG